MQVSRFFCTQPTCLRKTFTEAIPAVAERYARRTARLKEVLENLDLALGGEAASRLTAYWGCAVALIHFCVCYAVSPKSL